MTFREALAAVRLIAGFRPPLPVLSVKDSARRLIEYVDNQGSESHDWDFHERFEALRDAIASDDEASHRFRAQFTGSAGITQDPNVKYEIWN